MSEEQQKEQKEQQQEGATPSGDDSSATTANPKSTAPKKDAVNKETGLKGFFAKFSLAQLKTVDVSDHKYRLFRTKMHPEEWHDLVVMILMLPITILRIFFIIIAFIIFTVMGVIFDKLGFIHSYLTHAAPLGNLLVLRLAGIKIHVEGEENILKGTENAIKENRPVLVVSNHISALDPHAISVALGKAVRPVIKIEIFSIPVYGTISKLLGCIGVDRTKPSGVVTTLKNYFVQNSHTDFPLYMCPEGTTTNGEAMLKFKKGIFLTDVEVLPFCLTYKTPFNTSFVLNQPSLGRDLFQLFKVLCSPQNKHVFMKVLPPMKRNLDEDHQAFADRVAGEMASSLGIEYTSLSNSDGLLFYAARRYKIAQEQKEANKKDE